VVTVKRAVLDSVGSAFPPSEKALRPVLLKSECGSAGRELTAPS